VSSVLRPHQHSIGYTGDGFYRSKDPTNTQTLATNGNSNKHASQLTVQWTHREKQGMRCSM